mmetsp:Transcript_8495/g.16111  ORF Transcript_8495/g.16111 Transcript_8495/m.16111 type:complete len:405 (+) Transcript_8495:66-1280(+)
MSVTTDNPEAQPAGAYANLAPDKRGHSSWFLSRTNREHRISMEHPFMKSIYARTFDEHAYAFYLAGQYHVFAELERVCASVADSLPLKAVYDEALHRSKALEEDLEFWGGKGWRTQFATPSDATTLYLARLKQDSSDPWMLLCHHFLQYNAVLSGGQYLGKMVSARAASLRGDSPTGSDAFYTFVKSCQPTHARVQQYIEDLDELSIDDSLRSSMLSCMQQVYKLIFAMFDEAYQLAPTSGISYENSKSITEVEDDADSAGEGSKSTEVPAPLEPMKREVSSAELAQHGAKEAVIWTSLLGRVYDVTSGREMFGSGGAYEVFAGHDGTYMLAVMSLKKKFLDKFVYEFDDEEKETLSEWIAYFDTRYGPPIGQLSDKQHCLGLSDLPRAQKIPFSNTSQQASKL